MDKNTEKNAFKQNSGRGPNGDALYHVLMSILLMLNGMSVGGVIRSGTDLMKDGYDSDTALIALMYLLCAIYTGKTAYRIYCYKREIDQNNKHR